MKVLSSFLGALSLLAVTTSVAGEFSTRVIASGLNRPTGIVAGDEELYLTEVPNPATPNAGNGVKRLDLDDGTVTVVNTGEPEPVNLAMDRHGQIYWTCKSAGVILTQDDEGQTTPVLTGLSKPSGIAIDRRGNIYFTQLPTPGVPGSMGGLNNVSVLASDTVSVLYMGEPEPQDIAVSRKGELYWTCKTAGVILERNKHGEIGVLLDGLNHPVGIALNRQGDRLYWTEVPTPGVGGASGGQNKVWELNLRTMKKTLVDAGDPEPTDIAVGHDGDIYWTCTSAGVIVEASRERRRH